MNKLLEELKMVNKMLIVRKVFGKPDWYLLSEQEENKLFKSICDTRDEDKASLFHFMDCTTICDEQFCYFCLAYWGDIMQPCSSCHPYKRE